MVVSPPILVEVPICAFRPYASREYQDTYPVPTPASVYGMLLSLLGVQREQKSIHRGSEMVLGVERLPARSRVFRKLRRGGELESTRPDYQDLLIDLRLWVWLRSGADCHDPPLALRVPEAYRNPESIVRSGGLSLGESSYLVDGLTVGSVPPPRLVFVDRDDVGFFSLPVWVDHVNAGETVLLRYQLKEMDVEEGLAGVWTRIGG